jgi:hypothetical protein
MSYDLNQEIAYRPRLCNRARLLACPAQPKDADKPNQIPGFTGCAERLQLWRFVTGHDFSRADKANRINRDLAPADVYCANLPDIMPFFRSLFSP